MNVRGIRDITKRKSIFLFCRRKNADLIFLQETHSIEDDVKLWKSQWGELCFFSHGTNLSAGVAVLTNKFRGDVIEFDISDEGRWIILITKLDGCVFITCNVYSYNGVSLAKNLFTQLGYKIEKYKLKFPNSYLIIGGDFNDAPDDHMDRIPPRDNPPVRFKCTSYTMDKLNVVDVWRFLNPNTKEFTWSNTNRSLCSRIDLWLTSTNCLQYIKDVSHSYAPLSDHQVVSLHLGGNINNHSHRGYWKLNTNLLKDEVFSNMVKMNALYIFKKKDMDHIQKWEFFKFKTREIAIRRSKEIKRINAARETNTMTELNSLLSKTDLNEEEEGRVKNLKDEIDKLYMDLTKGAFIRSRSKWLEQGERNSAYFFALEKRNQKRNSITSLRIEDKVISDHTVITGYVENFYRNIYTSVAQPDVCHTFMQHIKNSIPTISEQFYTQCEDPITKIEMASAARSMKTGKSPGNDGLPVEFYLSFWDIIEGPLFEALTLCIENKELSTSMKQGAICLIPKPQKDPQIIENWRPITLLNVDYKIMALMFAKRLKRGLGDIISETQTGFMSNRHISSNIRLILDLIDYPEFLNSHAFILFLDFYKAFDTVEHNFLFKAVHGFGFGPRFSSAVQMLYKNISSSVMLYPHSTARFPVSRSVRQGCPVAPFLFLLVVECLAIFVKNNFEIKGIQIFGREIKITQLADDTALFLQDKHQVEKAISTVSTFSDASGLRLNMTKCELMCLFDSNDPVIANLVVKEKVKYLGIEISKNVKERQQLNFLPQLKKTKTIFNLWKQRDVSIWGRTLLTKAEGISRFVYPAMSLNVEDSICNDINKTISEFVWKNKHPKLKRNILTNSKETGGLELIDFSVLNQSFKVKWIKQCLTNSNSLWFFIPTNIFSKLGGLPFLLKCNFSVSKLPIKLCAFYQQALLAWKIAYKHNFSPHKAIIWNNQNITKNGKSLFVTKWKEKNITLLHELFDKNGKLLTYEAFLRKFNFPVTSKEFSFVIKSIPSGLLELMKAQGLTASQSTTDLLLVGGIDIKNYKCSNKHIRNSLRVNKVVPACKAQWNAIFSNINWQTAWLIPSKYCINNKIKELHWKILHKIYPTNLSISKFKEINPNCTFCNEVEESLIHLFFECKYSKDMWTQLAVYLHRKTTLNIFLRCSDIILYYEHKHKQFKYIVNLFILIGKNHIHKSKFSNSKPRLNLLLIELKNYISCLNNISNKNSSMTLNYLNSLKIAI